MYLQHLKSLGDFARLHKKTSSENICDKSSIVNSSIKDKEIYQCKTSSQGSNDNFNKTESDNNESNIPKNTSKNYSVIATNMNESSQTPKIITLSRSRQAFQRIVETEP